MAFVSFPASRLALRPSARSSAKSPRRTLLPRCSAVKPIADRVIVRVDKAASQTKGGLFLGGDSEKEQCTGTVVAVGPGRYSQQGKIEEIHIAPGDQVMWKDDYGAEKLEGGPDEELLVLKAFSVVAKW